LRAVRLGDFSLPAVTRGNLQDAGGGWSEHASESKSVLTGGCQCGAIRFAVSAHSGKIHLAIADVPEGVLRSPFASFADIEHSDFNLETLRKPRGRSDQPLHRPSEIFSARPVSRRGAFAASAARVSRS